MRCFGSAVRLAAILLPLALSQGLIADQYGKSPQKLAPDSVVYRGDYPGWPWVDRTPGGKLISVWREGTRHMFSAEGKLMLSESDDAGKTWAAARTFYDGPEIDDRNVAILTLSDRDWLVCFNTYTETNVSRVYTLRTKDAGRTWSKPQLICDFDARTRAAPVKLSTGELVLPFYSEPPLQSIVAISQDDGEHWQLVKIANLDGFLGDEWDIAELPDGRLVGIIRNSAPGSDGSFYKTESRDRGQTWTDPVRTNLRSSRYASPAEIFVHAGRPVVVYSDARMVSVCIAVSDDPDLVEWNIDQRLQAYNYHADGTPIQDGTYPVSVSIGGNRRLIVDYVIDGDFHAIPGYVVEMPAAWFKK